MAAGQVAPAGAAGTTYAYQFNPSQTGTYYVNNFSSNCGAGGAGANPAMGANPASGTIGSANMGLGGGGAAGRRLAQQQAAPCSSLPVKLT